MQREVASGDEEEEDDSVLVNHALKRMAQVIESKRTLFSNERLDGATNSMPN